MLVNFNSLDFCVALFTISTCCCFLFFNCCCCKKKARPNPKRGTGAPNILRTNMNQIPSGEGRSSKKQALPKDVQQKMGKSPTKPSPQQQKPTAIKSNQVKKAASIPNNSEPAMLPRKKNELEPVPSSPDAVIADSEAYMGPSPQGIEVPETVEQEDDESTPMKENKAVQTDLRRDQIDEMVATISEQQQALVTKPSTSDMAQQTSTRVRPAVHHHRHHGKHSLIEIVKMVDKGQQTSARISKETSKAVSRRRRAPSPPADKRRKETPKAVSRRAPSPPADKRRKETPKAVSRRAPSPPVNKSKRATEDEPSAKEQEDEGNVDAKNKSAKEDSKSSEESSEEESEE